MNEITTTRSNPLIDPTLHIWHAEIPLYLFLGGLVAGLMVISGLWLLRRPEGPRSRALALLPWMAPILLSVGMLFLWLDLENRLNAFRFYLAFQLASPMSWGSWILLAVYPVTVALAWHTTPQDLRARVHERLRAPDWLVRLNGWIAAREKGLAIASVVLGAALGVYTGVLLGTLAARPLWNSAILGPLFLISGISTGAAFMLLYRLEAGERRLLARADLWLIGVELFLIAIWLVGLLSGGAASQAAAGTLLGGPYTAAFWTLVVAVGLLTPLVAEWIELRRGEIPGRFAAGLVLVGGLALRWVIVYAGQHAGWPASLALF
ncbi:MAG: polysulfide reductase NrfD [Gemmatimonadota bacterium]|nr:polysulfide reductase NrfD [Gemmatimonadota bacterium]